MELFARQSEAHPMVGRFATRRPLPPQTRTVAIRPACRPRCSGPGLGVSPFQFARGSGDPGGARGHDHGLLLRVVAVDRGDVDHLLVAHEAITGVVDDRAWVRRTPPAATR